MTDIPPPPPPSSPPPPPPAPPRLPPPPPPPRPPFTGAPAPRGQGPRRRTWLIIGAVLVVLALAGGAITAVVLGSGNDQGNPQSDDKSTSTSEGTNSPAAPAFDPVAFERTLFAVAAPIVTDVDTATVKVRSWDTAQENLEDGRARWLVGAERAQGTEWYLDDRFGGISASYPPSDVPDIFLTGCIPDLSSCTTFTTADGRSGIDYWIEQGEAWAHTALVNGAADKATITASEVVRDPGKPLGEIQKLATISSARLQKIAGDPRLLFPFPDPGPGLPSLHACTLKDAPADCPDWITAATP